MSCFLAQWVIWLFFSPQISSTKFIQFLCRHCTKRWWNLWKNEEGLLLSILSNRCRPPKLHLLRLVSTMNDFLVSLLPGNLFRNFSWFTGYKYFFNCFAQEWIFLIFWIWLLKGSLWWLLYFLFSLIINTNNQQTSLSQHPIQHVQFVSANIFKKRILLTCHATIRTMKTV